MKLTRLISFTGAINKLLDHHESDPKHIQFYHATMWAQLCGLQLHITKVLF